MRFKSKNVCFSDLDHHISFFVRVIHMFFEISAQSGLRWKVTFDVFMVFFRSDMFL